MLQFLKQTLTKVLTVTALAALPFGAVVSDTNSAESTATQPLRKVMIGYSAISPSQAPAWIVRPPPDGPERLAAPQSPVRRSVAPLIDQTTHNRMPRSYK